MNNFPSPKELDNQSMIKLDGWVDLDSDRWRDIDDNPDFTKKCIKMGLKEPAFLFTDNFGRLWGKGENGKYYPFHLEYGKKLYGVRIAKKAAN